MAHPSSVASVQPAVDTARRQGGSVGGRLRQFAARVRGLLGRRPEPSPPALSDVRRLVFVCTSNLHRSAFAQAVAAQQGLHAASFGLHTMTGQRTVLETVLAAAALGVRLDKHRALHRRDFVPAAGDLYLAMERRHVQELLSLGFAAHRVALLGQWSTPCKPQIAELRELSPAHLRRCFTRIEEAVWALAQALQAPQPEPAITPPGQAH